MKKIKMLTSYRNVYLPNEEVFEDDKKASELVGLGRAVYLNTALEPEKRKRGRPKKRYLIK